VEWREYFSWKVGPNECWEFNCYPVISLRISTDINICLFICSLFNDTFSVTETM
jgi:hypothetical protein